MAAAPQARRLDDHGLRRTGCLLDDLADALCLFTMLVEKGDDGMKLYGLFKALSEYMSTIQTLEEQPEAAEIIKFLGLESFKTIDEIYKVRSKEPKYELPNETKQYLMKYRAAVDREKVDA